MLMQMGVAAQIETLVALAGATDFHASKQLKSLIDLTRAYRKFLASLGQRSIDVHSHEPTYTTTTSDATKLTALFSNNSILDDKSQATVIAETHDPEWEQKRARIEHALNELSIYCSPYAELFKTIVTTIFISPSAVARAGSTSHAIGVIWMNPKLSYTTLDLVEILLHEFTHQTMFLDELRYGHYSYRALEDRSTWATSAILNVSRPLDKVLHSVVVAAEVLLFRHRYIGQPAVPRVHPPTEKMLRQLRESLTSVEVTANKYPGILTPRGNMIVAGVRQLMQQTFHSLQGPPNYTTN
jgi:HEXXH motif-containing protein